MTSEAPKPPRSTRRRTSATTEPTPISGDGAKRPRRPRVSTKAPATPPPPEPVPNSRPVVVDPDALPGEEKPGEPPFKLTVNVPQSLYERAAGLVAHADFTGEPPEVDSMTALVRLALVEKVAAYEKKYNAGMAFPTPHRLRRGRAPRR